MKKLALTAALLFALVPVPAQALSTNDLLSLIAMPLAVDAVANTRGVDLVQLASLVANLNQANVPPADFVQVVRDAPTTQPEFVPFVQTQVSQGVTGPALVAAIDQQRTVQSGRVEQHPHGGPPGQLKKIYGYQTGAEVVHGGVKPGRQFV